MHAHTRPIPKATDPRPPPSSPSPRRARGHWQQTIAGRVCPIDTRQLMLVWWLHTQGHLTRRQLRVWFALHEMLGRRLAGEAGKTAKAEKGYGGGKVRRPSYGLEELRKLLGTDASDKALRADLATLDRLGVATMTERTITLAPSIERVTLPMSSVVDGDPWADYHALLDRIPAANRRRTIPIPRRTLRALAAGFSRGTTAVMLAMLIRCLFRHGPEGSGQKGHGGEGAGRYRIDGRTKGSWIAQTFGVSRRAVTEGRARLIEVGWLTPLDCSQIELNRWGTHDRINPDWTPPPPTNLPATRPRSAPGSASPKKNQNPSIENLNQNPRTRRADRPTGPCRKGRGVKPTAPPAKSDPPPPPPRLRDIRPQDLRDNDRLLALLDQAAAAGQWGTSEADRLDFFALAERARVQANNPPAMFRWLIQHHRRTYIAQSDEDRAMSRLRELRNGPDHDHDHDRDSLGPSRAHTETPAPTLTETDRLVRTCLQVARDRRLDPYRIASQLRPDWTRIQWDDARMAYEHAELQRWHQPTDGRAMGEEW